MLFFSVISLAFDVFDAYWYFVAKTRREVYQGPVGEADFAEELTAESDVDV